MKLTLNKSVTLNVPKKGEKDKVDVYQIVAGQPTVELPQDIAEYVLKEYKDNIIKVDDTPQEEKSIEELKEEVKESAPQKEKEYQEQKDEEANGKKTGINLSDIAKQS